MMCTLVFVSVSPHTKFEMPSLTYSKDMVGPTNYNGWRDHDHATL